MSCFAIRGWRFLVQVALLAVVTGVAVSGITHLSFNDDYRLVFRSHAAGFQRLVEVFDQFGVDEADLTVVIEAEDATSPASLEGLDRFEARLYELEPVTEVISILSVPDPIAPRRPLFLPGLPESPTLDAARRRAQKHPFLSGMLSSDRQTTAVLVQLGVDLEDTIALRAALDQVRGVAEESLQHFDRYRITGIPAIRLAVRDNALDSQRRYALMAGALATLISALLFRSPGIMASVALGPVLAVIWTLGLLGWMGHQINLINHLIIELVLVIAFTDAVHLALHIRRRRCLGEAPKAAAWNAVRSLGVPCFLTSLTTAIGFGSLWFARLDIVRYFGIACAAGTLIGFIAVLSATPLTSLVFPAAFARLPNASRWSLERFWLFVERHARGITTMGFVLIVVCGWMGLGLRADYRYRDFAPAHHEAVTAMVHADQALGGAVPLRVVAQWPAGRDLSTPQVRDFLARVQTLVANAPMSGATVSILDLMEVSGGSTFGGEGLFPEGLSRRLVREDLERALISSQWPDAGAARQLPELQTLARQLADLSAEGEGYKATLAGMLVMSAKASSQTITDLARSLSIAASVIFAVLLVAFRSLRLALIGMLANLLPLAGVSAMLRLSGQPLEYSTVLGFTICIGLAVDDTIHFLAHYRSRRFAGSSPRSAVLQTLRVITPVLTVTTAILLAGFSTLLTSTVPSEVRMGALACGALILALLADLVLLPALLFAVEKNHS